MCVRQTVHESNNCLCVYVEETRLFSLQTGRILTVAEEIIGPYVWGHYDILVLPPSFPYGGMENPCLTFVSPTVLVSNHLTITCIIFLIMCMIYLLICCTYKHSLSDTFVLHHSMIPFSLYSFSSLHQLKVETNLKPT